MRSNHFFKTFSLRAVLRYAVVLLAVQASAAYAQEVAPNVVVAPYAGHVNHAHQSPTFRWGWFGAEQHYPRVHWHQGYNGDLMRWSEQRRY